MPSRRKVIFALVAWIVVLFVVGAVWRAYHPPQPPPAPLQERFVDSRQKGYYVCLRLAANARERHDVEARKQLLRRVLPDANQAAALRGCHLALRN
jgi:hypothetical protein